MEEDLTFLVVEPIHPCGIMVLEKHGRVVQLGPGASWTDILRFSGEVDALITRGFTKIPREVLEASKRLKVIGVHGVGVDHIDVDFAAKRGIRIVRTPEALADSVAEFTVSLMLSLLRKIPSADAAVRKGEWNRKYGDLVGAELMGKTVGVLGLGRIGSAVAKRLRGFDVNLIYYKRNRNVELERLLGVEYVSFHELLKASDIITVHVPLTPDTYHMISFKEFALMKHGVYIVNTARGAVIDEKALYEALVSGKVAGAALDVFEAEPLSPDNPLTGLGNVILTPHLAASCEETLKRLAVAVAEKVVQALKECT
ncbi:MAG: hydroxyacid dehydrogenase [Candidatus Bathyarchaeota archaeon]|nr:hydroxyacid dehydrogenase [Candidatus Bathyarchaeota archaeon]